MKNQRLLVIFCIVIAVSAVFLPCTRCTPLTGHTFSNQITLVSYNVQTFFDAVEDGTEFKEFKGGKSRWTEQKYHTRLERLKTTLFTAGEKLCGKKDQLPDIVVLQEVESNRVVEDFCKKLPQRENYPYAICPPLSKNDAFTTVLLSKYPIQNFFIHYLYTDNGPSLRPITEAVLNTGTQNKPQLLTVFSVHWKSKAGAADSTAVRTLQEAQLIRKIEEHRIKNPDIPFIVCGDFNQSLEECNRMQDFSVCWELSDYKTGAADGSQPSGSYYFKELWEKIDHIFYGNGIQSGNIEPVTFFVLYEPPLIDGEKPVRYNVITGEGYSDHLPLGFAFELHH